MHLHHALFLLSYRIRTLYPGSFTHIIQKIVIVFCYIMILTSQTQKSSYTYSFPISIPIYGNGRTPILKRRYYSSSPLFPVGFMDSANSAPRNVCSSENPSAIFGWVFEI